MQRTAHDLPQMSFRSTNRLHPWKSLPNIPEIVLWVACLLILEDRIEKNQPEPTKPRPGFLGSHLVMYEPLTLLNIVIRF